MVRRVFIKERGLELALPGRIGREGIAVRELPARVQIQQFRRHGANGGPRLVTLPLPRRGAEAMQARRGRVAVADRAIRFELVDPIQGNVQAIAPLVFHHGNLERGTIRTDGDGLQAAIDTDAMLQVHDISAGRQRSRGGGRDRAAVAARAAQPSRAAEDLVIGEHSQRGNDESAIERTDHERRAV